MGTLQAALYLAAIVFLAWVPLPLRLGVRGRVCVGGTLLLDTLMRPNRMHVQDAAKSDAGIHTRKRISGKDALKL